MAIRFYSTKKIVNDCVELTIRLTYNGKDVRSASKIFVPIKLWDEKKQRIYIPRRNHSEEANTALEANNNIEQITAFINNSLMKLYGEDVTQVWLKNKIVEFWNESVKSKANKQTPVSEFCLKYLERNSYARTTVNQILQLEKEINEFSKIKRTPLYIESICVKDLCEFEKYLKTTGKCQNTINCFMRKFRAVVRWCYLNDITDKNPFEKYKIKECVYGTPNYLTIDERNKIYDTKLKGNLDIQKDIFIFQCHIGCRVSDLTTFTDKNIDGDFLQYVPRKTRTKNSNVVRVPLSDTAKEIIDKYRNRLNKKGKLLPFISDQKYNEAIKEVLKQVGINRLVIVLNPHTFESVTTPICEIASSHLARRTFMKNMFVEVKSERIVSSFTGHADGSRSLSRYIDVDDETKRKIIQNL